MGVTDAAVRRIETALAAAVLAEGRELLELARRDAPRGDPELDPDPGTTLANSGSVRLVRTPLTGRLEAEVTFDTPYAAKQELDQRLKHPRGGRSAYLGSNVKRLIPEHRGKLSDAVRRVV